MEDVEITEAKWKRYRRVQHSGRYNMLTEAHNAMRDASLSHYEYLFIIKNFEALFEKFEGKKPA